MVSPGKEATLPIEIKCVHMTSVVCVQKSSTADGSSLYDLQNPSDSTLHYVTWKKSDFLKCS